MNTTLAIFALILLAALSGVAWISWQLGAATERERAAREQDRAVREERTRAAMAAPDIIELAWPKPRRAEMRPS